MYRNFFFVSECSFMTACTSYFIDTSAPWIFIGKPIRIFPRFFPCVLNHLLSVILFFYLGHRFSWGGVSQSFWWSLCFRTKGLTDDLHSWGWGWQRHLLSLPSWMGPLGKLSEGQWLYLRIGHAFNSKEKVASRRKKANQYRSFQKKKISRFEYYSVNFFGLVTFTCYVCAGSW